MPDYEDSKVKIKIIGVGGAGGNAIQHMMASSLQGVQFYYADTDLQALKAAQAVYPPDVLTILQLGEKLVKGLGAGSVEMGHDAALESIKSIKEIIGDVLMVFVIAGMGGGTGTGAAPIIAKVAKKLGALTIGVVSNPLDFDGEERTQVAEKGIIQLCEHVDSLIVTPKERVRTHVKKQANDMLKRFKCANDVLYLAVRGILDPIMGWGYIGTDFADVLTVFKESGLAKVGIGLARGEDRAYKATILAMLSLSSEGAFLADAKSILVNMTFIKESFGMDEYTESYDIIRAAATVNREDVEIVFACEFDESMGDKMRVTIIATDFHAERLKARKDVIEPPFVPVKALVQLKLSSEAFNSDDEEIGLPAFVRKQSN